MPPLRIGRCALGNACTAPDQAIDVQYQCRKCKKQLHGFRSACSMAANENDFREGVICKDQPCVAAPPAAAQPSVDLQAAGLPEFLWDTQRPQQPAGKKRTTKAADNSKGKTPEATAKKRKERDESGASGKVRRGSTTHFHRVFLYECTTVCRIALHVMQSSVKL